MTTNAFSIATKEMVFCLVDVLLRKMVIVIEFNVPLLHALNKYYLNQILVLKGGEGDHNPSPLRKQTSRFMFIDDIFRLSMIILLSEIAGLR